MPPATQVPPEASAAIVTAAERLAAAASSLKSAADAGTNGGMPFWVVCAALVTIGLMCSVVAFVYAVRVRRDAASLLKALGGGSAFSVAVAWGGTQITGVSAKLTWTEAFAITVISFGAGTAVCALGGFLFLWRCVIRPLTKRYGTVHGVRVWIEFWSGVDPLQKWISQTVRNTQADVVWDEFSCALIEAMKKTAGGAAGVRTATGAVMAFGGGTTCESVECGNGGVDSDAIKILREVLKPPIHELVCRLSHTTLNFTVWRVAEHSDELENLVSLPIGPGHEAGQGVKEPLKIWTTPGRCQAGSLASEAMLEGHYQSTTEKTLPSCWPKRKLGQDYDAIAAMPVPCDGSADAPWAVVCVEARDGTLPVDRHAMRMFMGALAAAVHGTAEAVRRRTIDDARTSNDVWRTAGEFAEDRVSGVSSSPAAPAATPTVAQDVAIKPIRPHNAEVGTNPALIGRALGNEEKGPA